MHGALSQLHTTKKAKKALPQERDPAGGDGSGLVAIGQRLAPLPAFLSRLGFCQGSLNRQVSAYLQFRV